jgi:transglutaminase-like putative cysteine protease
MVRHKTAYSFHQSVNLWPHRLVLRPRESRDLRLLSHLIKISPVATLHWSQDVFGNAIATARFEGMSDRLVIESVSELQIDAAAWPVFDIAASASSYPFRYSEDELIDLGALAVVQTPEPSERLREWAKALVRSNPTDTLALLKDLNEAISATIRYECREEEGTRSAIETLSFGSGSCRDFAVLFAEAARALGFAARLVSGYLHDPDQSLLGTTGPGSTHAWADIFIPGAGWISFDPTNRSVGGRNLIPVAVARDINQIAPVAGTFGGAAEAFAGMSVEVTVASKPTEHGPPL